MPFTFSHPAIVLPLLQKRLRAFFSSTGLIVGSMAPDFESFIRIGGKKTYSHTWPGIFWFDLPMALILAFLFHAVIRRPLIDNLPRPLEERFGMYSNLEWVPYFKKKFFVLVFSLLIGITSHLLWDAFTHLNLSDPDSIASTRMLGPLRLYIILQYTCSLIGVYIIMRIVYMLPRTKINLHPKTKVRYWIYIALLSILFWAMISTLFLNDTDFDLILLINTTISSFLMAIIIVSFFYQQRWKANTGF